MGKTKPTYFPDDLDVWVMAGQSNMEGCGSLAESIEPDPRVWCFTTRHEWRIAKDPLHDLLDSRAPADRTLRLAATPPACCRGRDRLRPRAYAKLQSRGRSRHGGSCLSCENPFGCSAKGKRPVIIPRSSVPAMTRRVEKLCVIFARPARPRAASPNKAKYLA